MGPVPEKVDTFRLNYTPLSEEQKDQMHDVKVAAGKMLDSWNEIVPAGERSERSRCMAIARTHLETAVMYAVKAITTEQQPV